MQDTVRYSRDAGIGRIVLDRAPLNVLNLAMLEALGKSIEEAANDPSLAVLTIAGTGRAFSAGADVADHTADRAGRMLSLFHEAIRRLRAIEPPVVALVHGAALGGGAELAMTCDIVLVREDAQLGFPEIRLAAFPPVAAALLPTLIGYHRAMDLILSGRTLSAEEARQAGLVSRVIAAADFDSATREFARELASLSPAALQIAKRAVRAAEGQDFVTALGRAEAIYLGDLLATADAAEGVRAFLAKRPPRWAEQG